MFIMRGAVLATLCVIALNNAEKIELNINGCPVNPAFERLIPHQNCYQYYQCLNGIRVTRNCPKGLFYNLKIEACDWPQNVECGKKIITGGQDYHGDEHKHDDAYDNEGNYDPSEAPAICAKEGSDGVLVAHEKCTKFYKCSKGYPVALNCPTNLVYNPEKEYCDWQANVECGDRIIPDDKDNEENDNDSDENDKENEGSDNDNNNAGNCDPSEAPLICAKEGSDGVLVAHEKCTQFYKCNRGYPHAIRCPLGLLFNPPKEYCDWPSNVNCGDRLIPDENDEDFHEKEEDNEEHDKEEDTEDHDHEEKEDNYDPSEAPALCAAEESDGVMIAHEKCNHFYQCSGGKPVVLRCPAHLLFNSKQWKCDWPETVDCGYRYIPEENEDDNGHEKEEEDKEHDHPEKEGNNDPSQAPAICAAKDSDGVLVAHEKCNKLYVCAEGRPVVFACHPGLLYNPRKGQCDWPTNVDCANRIIPENH